MDTCADKEACCTLIAQYDTFPPFDKRVVSSSTWDGAIAALRELEAACGPPCAVVAYVNGEKTTRPVPGPFLKDFDVTDCAVGMVQAAKALRLTNAEAREAREAVLAVARDHDCKAAKDLAEHYGLSVYQLVCQEGRCAALPCTAHLEWGRRMYAETNLDNITFVPPECEAYAVSLCGWTESEYLYTPLRRLLRCVATLAEAGELKDIPVPDQALWCVLVVSDNRGNVVDMECLKCR